MTSQPWRVVFFGTPRFAVPSLRALVESSHTVVAAVTNPPRPAGRGRKLRPSPVAEASESLGIVSLSPETPRDPALPERLRALEADVFAVVAYSILPRALLVLPPQGAINVHPSLLPRCRGPAPIPWTLIRGEAETGVTLIRLTEVVDGGNILRQERIPIDPDETAGELAERLASLGARLLVETLDALGAGPVGGVPQDDVRATHAPKLRRADGAVRWSEPAGAIVNRIRGTNPLPGAFTTWRGVGLKLWRATVVQQRADEPRAAPGTVLVAGGREGLVIQAGEGAVRLVEVQPVGRRSMSGAAFVRGRGIGAGEVLGEGDPPCPAVVRAARVERRRIAPDKKEG